jgi:hypothetical protein
LAQRRRCPSDSAAPPPGDCTGFEIEAGSFLVGFDASGQYCRPFAEVLIVGDVEVGLAEQAGGEAGREDAVDTQCGEDGAVLLPQPSR